MYVTTFYSFKGGVGRTMALANAAATLALRGRRVLVVDFDIEAPGLDTFDALKPREEVPGVIDFVTRYLESGQAPDASSFIGECPPIGKRGGKLWIMPSGRNESYAANFNQVDWGDLYERHEGFLLFEDLKAQWKQGLGKEGLEPDYVLIDSRTGHTDTSGICTRQLPDAVVVLFFPNEQNLRGLIDVVGDIRAEAKGPRKKNIELHFVMSNVPDLDDEDRILESKVEAFQDRLGFPQEPMIVHRYDSLSLLNQVVFSKDRPKSRLAKEYKEVVHEIAVRNWNDRDGALEYIRRAVRSWRRIDDDSTLEQEEMLDRIEQAHRKDGEVLFRLGGLKEFLGDQESASLLIDQAIAAGYDKPEAYFERSRIREQTGDPDGASEDLRSVLKLQQVSPRMVRGTISRLMRLKACDREEVVNFPAVLSLDHRGKLMLASIFNRSMADARLAVSLLEPILDADKLSEDQRDLVRQQLGLPYMGLGRCSEAARVFRNEEKNIADLSIDAAFNYAMALWGENKTVQPEIFQHVVELDRSESRKDKNLNYLQCMAIAYWAVGDNDTALNCVKQAQQVVSKDDFGTEFSCWRYLRVDSKSFSEDLDEIHALIEGRNPRLPRFMAGNGNGPAEMQ